MEVRSLVARSTLFLPVLLIGSLFFADVTRAEDAVERVYRSPETEVYLAPGKPVRIIFPNIVGKVLQKDNTLKLDMHGNYIVAFAPARRSDLPQEGQLKAIELLDKRRYVIRFRWSDSLARAHEVVRLVDRPTTTASGSTMSQPRTRTRLLPSPGSRLPQTTPLTEVNSKRR